MIPFVDLSTQNQQVAGRILERIAAAAESSQFVGGEAVAAFEAQFANYCGVAHCVGLNSGTDALRLALVALELPTGSGVLTTPFSFVATVEAIRQAGFRPFFADIDDGTLNISAASVAQKMGKEISCVLPVHFGGNPCDMRQLKAACAGAAVVEDACQAHGSSIYGRNVGTFGGVGAFSFYPTKTLGAWGDAGAAVTDDSQVAARLRLLRDHGQVGRYFHEATGWNSRLDALQATVLLAKLECLEQWSLERVRLGALYDRLLADVDGVTLVKRYPTARMVPYLYTVRAHRRDRLQRFLERSEIGTDVIYPHPMHLLPTNRDLGYKKGDFPNAERICDQVLSLPMYPGLKDDDVCLVSEKIRDFYR